MQRDPAFVHASENWGAFREELDSRLARFEAKHGSLADLENEYQAQLLRARTCPECSFVCKTQHHMLYRHQNSQVCMRRVAEQLGKEFILPSRQRVTCECGIIVFKGNLEKHQQGVLHKNELAKKNGYHCELCGKVFKGKRPKKSFDAHQHSKKHKRRLAAGQACIVVKKV